MDKYIICDKCEQEAFMLVIKIDAALNKYIIMYWTRKTTDVYVVQITHKYIMFLLKWNMNVIYWCDFNVMHCSDLIWRLIFKMILYFLLSWCSAQWSSSRWQNNKTVRTRFIKLLKCPFHLEPDKEPDVRAETLQEDTPSNGAIAQNPSSSDTIIPFAWDITPPYETNKNSSNKPEQKFNSNLCVLLWPP